MARKMSNYRGNIASLLQSNFAIYQREDHTKRAIKIASAAGKAGNWPDLPTLQQRYNINETEAKKLLAAAKRQWTKRLRDAKALEAARAERRAMLEPVAYPRADAPAKPAQIAEVTAVQGLPLTPDEPVTATPTPEPQLKAILEGIRDKYGDEIRKRGEQTSIPEGFVYLVTHDLFPGWVKAGMTIDFEIRLGTYNISDPLSRFRFAALRWVPNRRQAERELLSQLADEADNQAGEWFEMPLPVAKEIFAAL
jgi:hypothetical protein